MTATKKNGHQLDALAAFFDDGVYTKLYADEEVTAPQRVARRTRWSKPARRWLARISTR